MTVLLKNNARSVLASSIGAQDTSILIRAGNGINFPEIRSLGHWFPLTIEDVSGNIEIMKATARNGDVFTVLRGQEGTTPRAWSANDVIELRITSALLQELAADSATNFSRIYRTTAEGLDPVTGVAPGYYFNVRSTDVNNYVIEYQNVNGVAEATGKAFPSYAAVTAININLGVLNGDVDDLKVVQGGSLAAVSSFDSVPEFKGTDGITHPLANLQTQALLNRTQYLNTTKLSLSGGSTTGTVNLNGSSTALAAKLINAKEVVTLQAAAAAGVINLDVTSQSLLHYTLEATANFSLNVRGNATNSLDSLMADGEAVTVVFMNKNAATPYYLTAVQVDGVAVTPKWQDGMVPAAGAANSIEIYTITLIKTAAATYTALASKARFA